MTRRHLLFLPLFATAALALGLLLVTSSACRPARKNLVLVTIPGLRADAIGPQTATLEEMTEQGQALETETLCPVTLPSLAGLFSSKAPGEAYGVFDDSLRLSPGVTTLAAILRGEGYRNLAVLGQGRVSVMSGLLRGLDSFVSPSNPFDQPLLADEKSRVRPAARGFYGASAVADRASVILRENADKGPLFLWVHLADLQPAILEDRPKQAYSEALQEIDSAVAFLRNALRSYGMDSSTVLAVVSLHGEGLGEGGEVGHGLTLAEATLRTPVLIESPAGRVEEISKLTQLRPQLLSLLGLADSATTSTQAADMQTTSLPERLFGWPQLARKIGDERPGEDEALSRVLRLMHQAYSDGKAGSHLDAATHFLEAAALAPTGLAPRIEALASLGREELKDDPAASTMKETLVTELLSWAPRGTDESLDLARALLGVEKRSEALALLESLQLPDLTPGQRLRLATLYVELGALEDALEIIEDEAGNDRDAPELSEWAGDLHLRQGNAYRARVAFEKAASIPRARNANLLAKTGDACAALDDHDAALAAYAEALSLDDSYRYPHFRAGEILRSMGDKGRAADAFLKSLPPTDDPAKRALAGARLLLEQEIPEASRIELQRGLEKDPHNVELQVASVRLEALSGQADKARELLTRWKQIDPDSPLPCLEEARFEAHLGREDAAIAALDAAERKAGPGLKAVVRGDPLFRSRGADSALAKRAAAFSPRTAGESRSR